MEIGQLVPMTGDIEKSFVSIDISTIGVRNFDDKGSFIDVRPRSILDTGMSDEFDFYTKKGLLFGFHRHKNKESAIANIRATLYLGELEEIEGKTFIRVTESIEIEIGDSFTVAPNVFHAMKFHCDGSLRLSYYPSMGTWDGDFNIVDKVEKEIDDEWKDFFVSATNIGNE